MLKKDLAKEVSNFIESNIEDDADLGETAASVEEFISSLESADDDEPEGAPA